MEVEAGEIQDWELLQPNPNSDNPGLVDSAENPTNTEETGADSKGTVNPNYFTIDSQNKHTNTLAGAGVSEAGSEATDNTNLIDSGSDSRTWMKNHGSDSEDEEIRRDSDGIGQFEERKVLLVENDENLSDGSDDFVEETHENEKRNEIDRIEKRKAVEARKWWKVPYEVLKCCVVRFNPVWTFSVAAAVMGFAILSRHLYKLRKKSRSLDIKVAMDNKKVSQFMSRAARGNEAFSAARRVPVIRLPAVATPWPVVSLR